MFLKVKKLEEQIESIQSKSLEWKEKYEVSDKTRKTCDDQVIACQKKNNELQRRLNAVNLQSDSLSPQISRHNRFRCEVNVTEGYESDFRAEHAQDKFVLAYFLPQKTYGTFVEFGAGDGYSFSNSYVSKVMLKSVLHSTL